MNQAEWNVRDVAHLARVELSEEEAEAFQQQLGKVLGYVEQISALDLDNVEPTAHANPVFNVFRADEPRASLEKSAVLANAPHQANGLFVVPKVIE